VFLEPLDQSILRPFGQRPAVVLADDKVHAPREDIFAFGHAVDLNAGVLEFSDNGTCLGWVPAEPVKLVDENAVNPLNLCVGQELQ